VPDLYAQALRLRHGTGAYAHVDSAGRNTSARRDPDTSSAAGAGAGAFARVVAHRPALAGTARRNRRYR